MTSRTWTRLPRNVHQRSTRRSRHARERSESCHALGPSTAMAQTCKGLRLVSAGRGARRIDRRGGTRVGFRLTRQNVLVPAQCVRQLLQTLSGGGSCHARNRRMARTSPPAPRPQIELARPGDETRTRPRRSWNTCPPCREHLRSCHPPPCRPCPSPEARPLSVNTDALGDKGLAAHRTVVEQAVSTHAAHAASLGPVPRPRHAAAWPTMSRVGSSPRRRSTGSPIYVSVTTTTEASSSCWMRPGCDSRSRQAVGPLRRGELRLTATPGSLQLC